MDIGKLLDFHWDAGAPRHRDRRPPHLALRRDRVDGPQVMEFDEKPTLAEGVVSGGFFVFQREVFDYLDDDPNLFLEQKPLRAWPATASSRSRLHEGFWHPMDTYRDYLHLNDLWKRGETAVEDLVSRAAPRPAASAARRSPRSSWTSAPRRSPTPTWSRRTSRKAEAFYPLRVYVCGECLLVQLPEEERPEAIFSDYAYFSSYSDSWLRHAEALRRGDDRALRPRRRPPGGRDRQQRRLPAALVRRAGDSGARHRAGGATWPRRPRRRASRPSCKFFGEADRPRAGGRREAAPTCWWATTSSPTCRTSTTSWPG